MPGQLTPDFEVAPPAGNTCAEWTLLLNRPPDGIDSAALWWAPSVLAGIWVSPANQISCTFASPPAVNPSANRTPDGMDSAGWLLRIYAASLRRLAPSALAGIWVSPANHISCTFASPHSGAPRIFAQISSRFSFCAAERAPLFCGQRLS